MAETKQPVEETKKDVVEVPSAVLKEILDKIDSYKEQMQKYETQISELKEAQKDFESTASQDQILKIEKLRATGKLIKSIRLNYWENKLVVAWGSTFDDSYIDNTGKAVEVQKAKYFYLDGTSDELDQVNYNRRKSQRSYEVIKEGKNREGKMLYTVMLEGGKELEISSDFIN